MEYTKSVQKTECDIRNSQTDIVHLVYHSRLKDYK